MSVITEQPTPLPPPGAVPSQSHSVHQSAIMPMTAPMPFVPFGGMAGNGMMGGGMMGYGMMGGGMGMMGGGMGMMAPSALPLPPMPGCPFGLEFLVGTDHLFVKQQVEMLEAVFTNIETPNKYSIINSFGQRIYFAHETSSWCSLQCSPSGKTREFTIIVLDFAGRQVLSIERPFDCGFCLLSSCNYCGTSGTEMNISLGDGSLLGTVKQQCNGCQPLFHINDNAGNLVAKLEGPGCADCCCACPGSCGSDVTFNILLPGSNACIGQITKQWGGFFKEMYTDADTFGVSFPPDLDVHAKAMILGATFLIDFVFFESGPKQGNHGRY